MPSHAQKNIGQGWVEMKDANGRIYYANKLTKQRSWQRPQLTDIQISEPNTSTAAQQESNIHIDQHGPRPNMAVLVSTAVVSSPLVPTSDEHAQARHRRHPPKQVPEGAAVARRKSKNSKGSSLESIPSSIALNVMASPPRRGQGQLLSAAVAAKELYPSPSQVADTSDDDSFIDDVPTSFARQRNAKVIAKPLAQMLENALAVKSDDTNEHQLVAIRKYFQELDRVSERPPQGIAESSVVSKALTPMTHQLPCSDDLLSIAATPREVPPSGAHTFANFEVDPSCSTIQLQTLASPQSKSHDLQVLRDVHISGATGVFADFVNGIFEPTLEHCCGMSVYRKRNDSDIWLEYSSEAARWTILDTAHRGQVWGWAYLTTHRSIEKCAGLSGWKIADGSRHFDDLNIRCHIFERSAPPTDAELNGNVHGSNILLKHPASARGSLSFLNVSLDPLNSACSDGSVRNESIPHRISESLKPLPPFQALSIIEQLERSLVKQSAASETTHVTIQSADADKVFESYGRMSWAIIRLQARFRGRRVRKSLRQNRLSAFVHGLRTFSRDDASCAPAEADKTDSTPQQVTVTRMVEATDAVGLNAELLVSGQAASSARGQLQKQQSVTSVFHPVHNSSSKNRSAIDAIVRTGVHSDDLDPNQLLLVLKKSKLFKRRKIADKVLPNASICCELVDFAVITFQLESREHAVQLFQKLVDSNHLKLPYTPKIFKDEHCFVILPRHEINSNVRSSASLHLDADFSIVVESIWRDNNMRIACSVVSDVMNNRDPRMFYEGWRSTLHDIAYSKGLRALMFLLLLVHVGLGFLMTREISWTGSCRDHPSEVSRVRIILSIESGFCALYILYITMRILAGFPKSLRAWFVFESALIVIMWADLGYSLGTFDDRHIPVRFSLPLRALMINCWSHRLRTHVREIYLSVRKLKVLGGAVLLWIIITATLVTIYVRIVCINSTTESTCSQLTNIYFDNAATSMVTLAIMMTTSNYGTVSQLFLNRPGQSTTGIILVFLGLILFMVISYFLLLSMMLAIVFDAFKKGKKQIMSEKADIFDAALIGAFSLLCERDSMSIKHDTYRRFMRMLIPNISTDRLRKYWEFLDADKNGSIALEEFLELSTIVSFQVLLCLVHHSVV
jgi:hypothetical protein